MKTFNHCDENFLSFDSVQKTSHLRMAEKTFLQRENDFNLKWKHYNIRKYTIRHIFGI